MPSVGEAYNEVSGNPFMGLASGLSNVGVGARKRATQKQWEFEADRMDKRLQFAINSTQKEYDLAKANGETITWKQAAKRAPDALDTFQEFMSHSMNNDKWGKGKNDPLDLATMTAIDTEGAWVDGQYGETKDNLERYALVARRKSDGKPVPITQGRSRDPNDPVVMASFPELMDIMKAQSSNNVGRPLSYTTTDQVEAGADEYDNFNPAGDPDAKINSFVASPAMKALLPEAASQMYPQGSPGLGSSSAAAPAAPAEPTMSEPEVPPTYTGESSDNVKELTTPGTVDKTFGDRDDPAGYEDYMIDGGQVFDGRGKAIKHNTDISKFPPQLRVSGSNYGQWLNNTGDAAQSAVDKQLGNRMRKQDTSAIRYGKSMEGDTRKEGESFLSDYLGRDVKIDVPGYVQHPEDPRFGVYADGVIRDKDNKINAVVELKSLENKSIPNELPAKYRNQTELAMEVFGTDKGYVVFKDAHGGKKVFEVTKDPEDTSFEYAQQRLDAAEPIIARKIQNSTTVDDSIAQEKQNVITRSEEEDRVQREGEFSTQGQPGASDNLDMSLKPYGIDLKMRMTEQEKKDRILYGTIPQRHKLTMERSYRDEQAKLAKATVEAEKKTGKDAFTNVMAAYERQYVLQKKFRPLALAQGLRGNYDHDFVEARENPQAPKGQVVPPKQKTFNEKVTEEVARLSNSRPVVAATKGVIGPGAAQSIMREAEQLSQEALTRRNSDARNKEMPKTTRKNYLWTTKAGRAAVGASMMQTGQLQGAAGAQAAARYAATGKWSTQAEVDTAYLNSIKLRADIANQIEARRQASVKASTGKDVHAQALANVKARQSIQFASNDEQRKQEDQMVKRADRLTASLDKADEILDGYVDNVYKGAQAFFGNDIDADTQRQITNVEGADLALAKVYAKNPANKAEMLRFLKDSQVFYMPGTRDQFSGKDQSAIAANLMAHLSLAHTAMIRTDPSAADMSIHEVFLKLDAEFDFIDKTFGNSKKRGVREAVKFRDAQTFPKAFRQRMRAEALRRKNMPTSGDPSVSIAQNAALQQLARKHAGKR